MKKLLRDILVVVILLAGSGMGHCQTHVVMQDGYTLTVDGTLDPTGTIADDGDTTGQYSNGFYGNVLITATPGDTIVVYGSYVTESGYDHLYLYDGSPLHDMGVQLGSWDGTGTLTAMSMTGSMTLVFSSDGSVTYDGFLLHYEVRQNHCASNIFSFSASHVGATSVWLSWQASDTTVAYRIHYGSTDTVVTGLLYAAEGLEPMTSYTFAITPVADLGSSDCGRELTLVTTPFWAQVSGLRPLCGMDTLTLVADSADGYLWSTEATTRSIEVTDTGWYWLVAYTQGGATDTVRFRVSDLELDIETHLPTALCPGDAALVTVGIAGGSSIQVLRGESTLSESARIFLPDGQYCAPNGCSYRSELVFSGFESNAHIGDVNDIRYVMLNIEHSWVGDIYINITCPNNQSADILRYGGSGSSDCNSSIAASSRGWQSGSNVGVSSYLGQAYDTEGWPTCDSTAQNNEPGVGWRYCWSNCTDAGFSYASGDGLIYRYTNLVGNSLDSSNVAAGTQFYHPDDSFANLVGCPMNGTWYIEVIDGWSGDNGYIFGWELALNPDRLSRNEYVPTVAYADLLGPYVTRSGDTSFVVTAPLNLTADTTVTYTVLITDSIGCVFDTTFTILFHSTTSSVVYDTVYENDLPHRYGGRLFNDDASDVVFHYPGSSGCDSLVVYNLYVRRNSSAVFDTTVCSTSLPLQWYHRTFTAAGTQRDTLANHLGADSLLTLTLHVIPTATVHVYDTICSNRSRTFEGTTYSTSGSYPHSFLSSLGCDSVRTLHLTVKDVSYSDTSATACDQFAWHDSLYTASTSNAQFVALNSVGCDSVVTLHLTIWQSYATHRYDTVCEGGSLSFAGQECSVQGDYMHTFVSQQGCDSVVTMSLYVKPTTYGDYYDTCIENLLPRTFMGITAWDDTVATVALTNGQGCDSLLTYHLCVLHNTSASFDTTFCADRLPLQWYHRIFYTAGTQHDTLVNHLGADSLLTLTMHVLPISRDTLVVTACDSYLWHDTTFTESNFNFQFSTFNSVGCDSTVTLHLTVNYSTDSNITAEACDSYDWFGTHYLVPPASSPVHVLTNSVGCDSVLRLVSLTLHYSQQIDDYDTVCLSDVANGYAWRDTVMYGIAASGSYAIGRIDQYGCDSLLTLDLTVYNSSSSQIYDTIVQNQASAWQYNGISLSTDTTISLTLANHWGCDSLVTYHLHVWPNVSNTIDTTVCANQVPSFTWNGLAAADTLVAILVGNHGVDSVVTLYMHVNPTYQIELYDTICDNSSITFAGQTLTTTGDYSDTFQSLQGCDSTVTIHLTVHPTYSSHFYDTIYVGDTIFFEGHNYIQPGNYPTLYQTVDGCDSLITLHLEGRNLVTDYRIDSLCEGDTFYFYGHPLTEAGVYVDTAYSGDFFAGDTVVQLTLYVVQRPEAGIVATPFCDAPAHYALSAVTDMPYLQWVGPGVIEGHEHDSVIAVLSPADTTLYTLYADYRTDQFCPAKVDTLLAPIPVLRALIDVRPTALTLEERHLTANNVSTGIHSSRLWYVFYNEEAPFTDTSRRLQLDVPMYVDSLVVVLNIGNDICTASDTVTVSVLRADILFPNVFTPSLSTNNLFHAYTTAVSEFELWIFDRRGALVFHTTDIEEGWDGTHNGTPLPQAAYVYKCRYRDQLTPTGYQNVTGTVTLLR